MRIQQMYRRTALAACCCLFAFTPTGRAEVILGYDPAVYNRFTGGYPDPPSTPTNNPTFYLFSLDFSGVGWKLPGSATGTAWNVTMIDDRHFIGAWHTVGSINVNDTLSFRPAGSTTTITRTIANLQQVPNADNSPSDVLLGTLNTPFLPGDRIAAYQIAPGATSQQVIYSYGRESAVGRNNVSDRILASVGTGTTSAFRYDYDQPNSNPDGFPSTVGPDESHLQGGDSGGPTFVLASGNQLQLLGAHMFLESYGDMGEPPLPPGVTDPAEYSGDSYLPAYAGQIAALIGVPEPSSLALVALSAAGATVGWWRARRHRPGAT
jgi:hypothetical protein